MRTIETNIYKFSELDDQIKDKVIDKLCDTNVNYGWYESVYDDAAQIGLKITGFDMDVYCHGKFTDSHKNVAYAVLNNHGKTCETYQTAKNYLMKRRQVKKQHLYLESIDSEFETSLLEDYRIILRQEYEFLTSKEAIIETINSNDYEFYADGTIYS